MKLRITVILTTLLLVAILMMGPVNQVFSAPPAAGPSITIDGATAPEGGVEVTYTINYSGVPATGGVQLVIDGAGFTANGFDLQEVVPAANQEDDNTLIWPYENLDASGSGVITITGIFNDPNTCDATITFDVTILDTHDPATGNLATDDLTATVACPPDGCEDATIWSVRSGDWAGSNGAQWNEGRVPSENDVVWIRPGDNIRLFALDTIRVDSLCNEGELYSRSGSSLIIRATDLVINYPSGVIRGANGVTNPDTGTAGQGSTVIIRSTVPIPSNNQLHIINRGQILGGNGSNGVNGGAPGGSIELRGNPVETTSKSIITAGRGGNILGTDSGVAGPGGSVTISSRNAVKIRNRVTAGNGGSGNPSATQPQDGGDAGNVWVMGDTTVDVRFSIIRAGNPGPGAAGGFSGFSGYVFVDPPDTIEVSGADIEGDVVHLYGGDDTDIDASGGMTTTTVISASQGITIAVGTNGTIDLSNNDNLEINVTGEGGEVVVASDIEPTLDDGDTLDDVVDQGTATDEESQILRNVSVSGPEVTTGEPGVAQLLEFSIGNNGPANDQYTVSVEQSENWPLTTDPADLSNIAVEGLDQGIVGVNVIPMVTDNITVTNYVTITVVAQSDGQETVEVAEVIVGGLIDPLAVSFDDISATTARNWLWLLPAILLLLAASLMASWRLVATRVK